MHVKSCMICLSIKPITEFVKRASARDGYRNECKPCDNSRKRAWITDDQVKRKKIKSKEYRIKNREKIRVKNSAYRSKNKEMIREKNAEYRDANREHIRLSSSKYYMENKDRIKKYLDSRRDLKREYDRRYVEDNRDKIIKRSAEYKKLNKEKIKAQTAKRRSLLSKAEGHHSHRDIKSIIQKQDHKCRYCQKCIIENGYHVDHVMPLSLGGSNWPSNIQILCPSCNLKKGAKSPVDFEAEIGLVSMVDNSFDEADD